MAMAATAAFSMAALNAALPSGVSTKTRSTNVCARLATGVSVRRSASVVLRPQTVTKAVGFQAFDGLGNENALQLRTGEFHCVLVDYLANSWLLKLDLVFCRCLSFWVSSILSDFREEMTFGITLLLKFHISMSPSSESM